MSAAFSGSDAMVVPHPEGESPYVSVRELWATENRLTATLTSQLAGTEVRLTAALKESDSRHEETHHQMREGAVVRHSAIDAFIDAYRKDEERDDIATAKREGTWRVFTGLWKGLTVLDQHWRIFAVLVALIWVLIRDVRVSL